VLRTSNSFFPLFSLSLLLTIQESILETQAFILAMELACSAGVGLNDRYRWVL